MAKRKLNKKVAIIGSLVLACCLLFAIVLGLRMTRNDVHYEKSAEARLIETNRIAKEALGKSDLSAEEKDAVIAAYKKVSSDYGAACAKSTSDERTLYFLFKLADFHLNKGEFSTNVVEFHPKNWEQAITCWKSVVNNDPQHIEGHQKLLEYFYAAGTAPDELGGQSMSPVWDTIKTTASDLVEAIERKGNEPDAFVFLARGRAKLEIADSGRTTTAEELVKEAIADLSKASEIEPDNVILYKYLARAELVKGRLHSEMGLANAMEDAKKRELELLEEAVEIAPDNVKAHINLFKSKVRSAKESVSNAANKESMDAAIGQVDKLEGEFNELKKRFSNEPEIYAAFTQLFATGVQRLNESIEAMSRAIELDSDNVRYANQGANLYYFKSSIEKDEASLDKAIELARKALGLPDAQELPAASPRGPVNRSNRLQLFHLLSTCYIERALSLDENERQEWISKAEDTIHEVGQIISSEATMTKWHGLVALAKGNEIEAIRLMYEAYEDLKAVGKGDVFLSYNLSQVFSDRDEIGLYLEFIKSAISQGIALQKPEAILEYSDILIKLGAPGAALKYVETYEKNYGESDEANTIKVKAHLISGQYEDAEASLISLDPKDSQTSRLKLALLRGKIRRLAAEQDSEAASVDSNTPTDSMAFRSQELAKYRKERLELLYDLLERNAEGLEIPRYACNDLVNTDRKNEAIKLIDNFIKYAPDNLGAKIYKQLLMEPDFPDSSQDRREAIAIEIISGIDDDLKRYTELGLQYQATNKLDEAFEAFTKATEISPNDKQAVSGLFDIAIAKEDFVIAEKMFEHARTDNLDECEGNFFAAKLAIAREEYQDALRRLDTCLDIRPVFPFAYVLKSQANAAIENYGDAAKDIRKAIQMVPQNGMMSKQLVAVLQKRNEKLGSSISDNQYTELEQALQDAARLNPQDWQFMAIYARYISDRRPAEALAIQQSIAKTFPNTNTYLLLGSMALEMGIKETNKSKKQGLLSIAESSLNKAMSLSPDDAGIRQKYSKYLRATGQQNKIAEMFGDDKSTLWRFYLNDGQYDKAKEILDELHSSTPKDIVILKGLILVAESTGSKDDLKKFSEELLAVDQSVDNELLQIQTFLESGLVQEAESKLASFRERHPDEARAMLLEAWATMKKGQLEKSLKLINRNLEIDPENPIAWRLRGQVNSLSGNLTQAIKDLQKSKTISLNPTIQVELARAYHKAGRTPEAIGELVIALQDDRTPVNTRLMLETLYMDSGRSNDLEKFYSDTLAKYPESSFWYFRAGRLALQQRNFQEAEKFFSSAMTYSESSGGGGLAALDGYLMALRLGKKYDEMFSFASKYINTEFAPVAYIQMGAAEVKLGNQDKAVTYYHKALDKAGTNDEFILKILSSMFSVLGSEEVISWCNNKLAADENSLTANLTMYKVCLAQKEYDKGLTYIDKIIEVVGEDDVQVWVKYAGMKSQLLLIAYMNTGKREYLLQSIDLHKYILSPDKVPNNTSIMNNLAYLLADINEQIPKALEYARRAHETAPDDANKMDTYAYVLCRDGQFKKAKEMLQAAIQIFEHDNAKIDWSVYKHLGMAHEGLGEISNAKELYERAFNMSAQVISGKDRDELEAAIKRVSDSGNDI